MTTTFLTPAEKVDPAPKPDGWHTYHVCGGVLRQVHFEPTEGWALCIWCGDRCTVSVDPAVAPVENPDHA